MTVGVVVMRSTSAAQSAVSDLLIQPGHAGVRAVSFPGTRAAGYGDAQRGWFHAEPGSGPYAFLYAAGFTDGRRGTGDLTTEPAAAGQRRAGPADHRAHRRRPTVLAGGHPMLSRRLPGRAGRRPGQPAGPHRRARVGRAGGPGRFRPSVRRPPGN